MSRASDLSRFYEILAELRGRLGGTRTLATCPAASGWPRRGVYFFFEAGEEQRTAPHGLRVVRVGTHAITGNSKSTLRSRLAAHRRSAKTGGGSHRASVFRKLVGVALCRPSVSVWREAAPPGTISEGVKVAWDCSSMIWHFS